MDFAVLYSNRAAAFLKRKFHGTVFGTAVPARGTCMPNCVLIAEMCAVSGDHHVALGDCERAIQLDKAGAKAYYRKCSALQALGSCSSLLLSARTSLHLH
jgi:hypothetical protein